MAASTTPRPSASGVTQPAADPAAGEPLVEALAAWVVDAPVAVAVSAGADSTALLLAATQTWPGNVRALHVHHGLQASADDFERFCRALCARLGVPLSVRRTQIDVWPGESVESRAREARYAALADMARAAGCRQVLLAQHADDQAETLLLALGRGAGLPGLSAMPSRFERHGMAFGRPWLAQPGQRMRAWLGQQGERWIDDPMNADPARTRSLIRHRVLPVIAEVFPAYRQTFARSAAHAAQAQALLAELARIDLASTGVPPRIEPLRALSRDRQANVLRHWLAQEHGVGPSAAQLDAALDLLAACTTRGHGIDLRVGAGRLVRDADRIAFSPNL